MDEIYRDAPAEVWKSVACNADREDEKFWWSRKWEAGTDTLSFAFLPWIMKHLSMYSNALSVLNFACLGIVA